MKDSKSAPILIMTATVRRTIQRLETGDLVGADDRVRSLEGVADVVRRASRFDPQLIPVLATLFSETLCVLRRGQGLEEGCVGRSERVVRRVVRVPERVASRLWYRVLKRQRWAPPSATGASGEQFEDPHHLQDREQRGFVLKRDVCVPSLGREAGLAKADLTSLLVRLGVDLAER